MVTMLFGRKIRKADANPVPKGTTQNKTLRSTNSIQSLSKSQLVF